MPFLVKPLKDVAQPKVAYNKSLPLPDQGGFRLMICGASGSGKTVLLLNLMTEFRKHFKKVLVWSQNLRQFKKHWQRKMSKHDVMWEHFREQDLRHHFDKMVTRNRKHPRRTTPMLLVFDDMLPQLQKSEYFKEILLVMRKEQISVIFTTHKYTQSQPIIRQNLTHVVLLSTNDLELGLLAAYLGLDRKEVVRAYADSGAADKYSFLYLIQNPAGVFLNFSDKKLVG